MRPLAVLTAIVFGSAVAIAFGLLGVLVVFIILGNEHPQLAGELGPLLRSSLQFLLLAAISGISLWAVLKRTRWRWIAQVATWFTLVAIAVLYWPR